MRARARTTEELSLTAYGTPLQPGENPRGERDSVKLGRYEVVRELGKGAMGIVYLAKDPLIGRLVALKTIRVAAHADDDEAKEFQQRFIREAQAAGILNHPSIVTVHDIGQDEPSGVSFIAMEYVEGNNLKEVLAQGRALTWDQIGEIIAQVADAIDFAHAKGIVHRDVKPANIILIEGNRAKITDFGIAKIASGGANLTTTGQFLGTPNYMAPEQIKGAPVDGRTDIFSLGICFYECLTRRKPFGGDSLTSISYKIVHEPFPSLHEINPQIPEGFEEVVGQCLAKDPSKRYQRGKDLAAAIRAVIRGERPIRPSEPVFADETVVTRDRERTPTIEIPFPDADAPPPPPPNPMSTVAVNRTTPAPAVPAAKARRSVVQKTLSNVRANPIWFRAIPPAIFFGLVALLLAGLLGAIASIRKATLPDPAYDTAVEKKVRHEHQLRIAANEALRSGRVNDAYERLSELQRLAPRSLYAARLLDKLSLLRHQDELSKQQLALAKQQFDEGLVFFNNKQYPEAIVLFEQSFHINPDFAEAGNYLKLAQQEEDKLTQAKMRAKQATARGPVTQTRPTQTATVPHTATTATQAVAPATPAQLTTIFTSPAPDGDIIVRVGSQVAVRENLWIETGRLMFKRKVVRPINVTRELTPANADIEVWINIPTLQIKEYRSIRGNFPAGSSHRLAITFDAKTRRFEYQLN
ncbi:MAG: eukaryotic-like serine/threonine-protein kinase [Acidobacteriota bacterium]|jgi:serine/threonine protein kinase|nr:eukaryotic-like serine/threonine-protein kinase [Acidobacteriota bacterium]